MSQIVLNKKVKERLGNYKKEEGCNTYSDAVNLLLFQSMTILVKEKELERKIDDIDKIVKKYLKDVKE